nr:immunoglobulin heavy chain junction region [Macaca mulatta]MOW45807.1 immunoglobulin heavy chain junction region [Macaca mulatta]MOW46053.1 immunoglobulin heavy chain junction region [Macaca mulatta]MOW46156.1 immunoglobulin heavy chain junction region [Macaca mulatta]MOW46191.1 immunoglobulin heavy chain junction region [Macaca mulatta]
CARVPGGRRWLVDWYFDIW